MGLVGGRNSVFEDVAPGAVYVPAGARFSVTAATSLEVALCSAPGQPGRAPRVLASATMAREVRGQKTNTRYVRNILPQTEEADSLLVVEVLTPGGHGNPEAHVVRSVRSPNLHSRSLAPCGSSGLLGTAAANSMTKMKVPFFELIDALTMS